jgi:antibiotic biosynthesis monooxygenase (ABM) superfamily enzyme
MFCLTLLEARRLDSRTHMPIHVAITRKVKAGSEPAFEESLREFFQDSFDHQGVLGVHLISPPPGSNAREYGILRTFTSEHERDAFYRSDRFGRWQKLVAELTEGERTYRELHGLEAWFRTVDPPARWKMAVLTWLGVWPTSLLVGILIGPVLANLPAAVRSAVIAAAIVVCLTWIVMPVLVKISHSWLH